MPNRSYEAGRRFEYELIKQLEEDGARFITRGAGSHGGDIVAIFDAEIVYIEAKKTNEWPPPRYEEEMTKIAERAKYIDVDVTIEFIIKANRRGVICFELIRGIGTAQYEWVVQPDKSSISMQAQNELNEHGWLNVMERRRHYA